jgi:hypothetical protein
VQNLSVQFLEGTRNPAIVRGFQLFECPIELKKKKYVQLYRLQGTLELFNLAKGKRRWSQRKISDGPPVALVMLCEDF